MSVYGSFGVFDGDEPNRPEPIIYRGSHVMPRRDDPRGGSLDLGLISGFVTLDGRALNDEDCWPYLRVSIDPDPATDYGDGPIGEVHATVVLDADQVERLLGDLAGWLARVNRSAR